jgi:uncharacterized protein (DUF433 family)
MNREKQLALLGRITIIPGLMSGKPTIRGLRFTVSDVLELLADGMNQQEILNQHPILQEEDIQAALLFASLKMGNTSTVYAA